MALIKSTVDVFDYALGLRDGTVIRFEEAEISGDFVRISRIQGWRVPDGAANVYGFARGVEVRVSEIVWVADAPQGS